MHICMHVSMHVRMHVCTYACMHVCMHACMHVCKYACIHACMYACMPVCMCVCMRVCMNVCGHACMHARMHACMHVRMHACMHVRMHRHELLTRNFLKVLNCDCGIAQGAKAATCSSISRKARQPFTRGRISLFQADARNAVISARLRTSRAGRNLPMPRKPKPVHEL